MTATPKKTRRSPGEGGVYPYRTKAGERWRIKAVVITPDGSKKEVNKRSFATKKAAQAALREALTASANGGHLQPSKQLTGRYLEQWLDGLRRSPAAVAGYKRMIRLHVVPRVGAVPLGKLTPAHLDKMYVELEKSGRTDGSGGLSAASVRYVHHVLSAAMRDAVEAGLVGQNPASKAHPPTVKEARAPEMTVWTASQLGAFLAWSQDNSALFPLWHVLAMTGMRRGEALALRWKDIALDQATITVSKSAGVIKVKGEPCRIAEGPTKSGKSRVIDIDAGTVAVLRAHKKDRGSLALQLARDDAVVFGSIDGAVRNPESVARTFTATAARATSALGDGALPAIRLHDLRHGHVTGLLQTGVPVHVVARRAGHASPTVTLTIYAHVMAGDQQTAASAFAALVAGAGG